MSTHLRRDLEPGQRLQHGPATPLLEAHDILWPDEFSGITRGENDLRGGGPDSGPRVEGRPVLGGRINVNWGSLLRRRFVIFRDRWRDGEIAQRRNYRLRRVGSDRPAGSEVKDVEGLHLSKMAVRFQEVIIDIVIGEGSQERIYLEARKIFVQCLQLRDNVSVVVWE